MHQISLFKGEFISTKMQLEHEVFCTYRMVYISNKYRQGIPG